MRFLGILALCLAGCVDVQQQIQSPNNSNVAAARTSQTAIDAYLRVAARIEPVAERLCRQKNPSRPASYCDFQIKVDTSRAKAPNAYQTIGEDGRPIIAFNVPMLAGVQNDDEIAFILGHEAGHQINSHIVKSSTNASLGALLLGGIFAASGASQADVDEAANLGGSLGARAYSQSHELEADVVGTYVASLAGYNPLIGAQSFSRLASGSKSPLSTHPPSNQRLTTVQNTVAKINADRNAGRRVRLP